MTDEAESEQADAQIGRREAHKRATRVALREAAARLFAAHGYEATTVRDIARGAGVTERTFYRYFDGKEGLIAEEALAWIDVLQRAIEARPEGESPFEAVQRAMESVVQRAAAGIGPARFWLFSDQSRPFQVLRRATPRPLLRVERSITDAIVARLRSSDNGPSPTPPDDDDDAAELYAQLLARVAVAVLRTAAIQHRRLRSGGDHSTGIKQVLQECFAALIGMTPAAPGRTDARRRAS